jgi:hypothetical protein
MTYQLLQNKHKLSADLMIADTLSQNAKITGSVAIRWIALLGFLLLRRKVWK